MNATVETKLSQNALDHFAMHVGQAVVPALEAKGQTFVIEAEQMQQRGLQVVDMDFVLGDREAEVVGLPVHRTTFDARAAKPHAVAVGIMITTEVGTTRRAALTEWGSTELATPDDQRVFEQLRCLRSFISAAIGLSIVAHFRVSPSRMSSPGPVPWKSQPQSKSCT